MVVTLKQLSWELKSSKETDSCSGFDWVWTSVYGGSSIGGYYQGWDS